MAITPQLSKYVNEARQAGMSDSQIRQELLKAGWAEYDIDAVLPPNEPIPPIPALQKPFGDSIPAQTFQKKEIYPAVKKSHTAFFVTVIFLLMAGAAAYFFLPQIINLYSGLKDRFFPAEETDFLPVEPAPNETDFTELPVSSDNKKECVDRDWDCMLEAVSLCEPVKLSYTSYGINTDYEIMGEENGECGYAEFFNGGTVSFDDETKNRLSDEGASEEDINVFKQLLQSTVDAAKGKSLRCLSSSDELSSYLEAKIASLQAFEESLEISSSTDSVESVFSSAYCEMK